jgi:hypothetical protein
MRKFYQFIAFFILINLLGVLVLPRFFHNRILERDPAVDTSWVENDDIDVILVGNSILGDGVSAQAFQNKVKLKATKIALGGSASAVWYLLLKNVIAPMDEPPQYIIIVFRDTFLTRPNFRVEEDFYMDRIEVYDTAEEEVLNQLAYFNRMSFIEYYAMHYLPIYRYQEGLIDAIDYPLKYALPSRILKITAAEVDEDIAKTFKEENMDPDLRTKLVINIEESTNDEIFDFHSQVNQSFLPYMIEIANQTGITLIFARAPRLAYTDGEQPDKLLSYIDELRIYLQDNGAVLFDHASNDKFQSEHFKGDDHLNEDGRSIYTQLLADAFIEMQKASR